VRGRGPGFIQFDDYETSTRVCPCGDRFTWSGFSDRLDAWMLLHKPHAEDGVETLQVLTDDGRRAYKPGGDE